MNPFFILNITKLIVFFTGSIFDNNVGSKDVYKLCSLSKCFNYIISIYYPKRSIMIKKFKCLLSNKNKIKNISRQLYSLNNYPGIDRYLNYKYSKLGCLKLNVDKISKNFIRYKESCQDRPKYIRIRIYYINKLGILNKSIMIFQKQNLVCDYYLFRHHKQKIYNYNYKIKFEEDNKKKLKKSQRNVPATRVLNFVSFNHTNINQNLENLNFNTSILLV